MGRLIVLWLSKNIYLEKFPQSAEFAIAVAEFCDSGYEMEEVFDYLLARDELSKLLFENDDVLFFRLLDRAKILGYNLQIGEAYMPSGYDVERLV